MSEDLKQIAPLEKVEVKKPKKKLIEEVITAKTDTYKTAPHPGGHPARRK